jgi:ubiquinone/menaquinone biosynthesis C-methylase UbiE
LEKSSLLDLQRLYNEGVNIIRHLRDSGADEAETAELILYSYDLQAGSYARQFDFDPSQIRRSRAMAEVIDDLGVESLLDAGTGESTQLMGALTYLKHPVKFAGFDISLSRLLYAKDLLERHGFQPEKLFTANLLNIPLADNSTDVVTTHHAIEPNQGYEVAILTELMRVSRRYLVLIEPSYEFGNEAQRERMDHHRYIRDLPPFLEQIGARVIRYEPWGQDFTDVNKAALIVAEKPPTSEPPSEDFALVSPISGGPINRCHDGWYCEEDGYLFPVVQGIGNLLEDNAIIATRYRDFFAPTDD